MTEEYMWDRLNATAVGQYLDAQERLVVNEFLNNHAPGLCLDIACGTGRFSIPLMERGINVVAADIDPIGLKKLNRKVTWTRNKNKTIHALQVDAHSLPFRDETFDCILSIQTAGYLDVELYFSECNRILKKGGWLMFNEANRHSYKSIIFHKIGSSTLFYRYSHEDICSMLVGNGFQIMKTTGMNWLPGKRNSNFRWVPFASKIERKLGLRAFPSISPWVFYIAQKNGHTLDYPRSDTTGGNQW